MENIFDGVLDPHAKAALDEILVPGACKSVLGNTYEPLPDMADPPGFPPEPSELYCASFAYLREGAPLGIKQDFLAITGQLPSTKAAVRLHKSSIDTRHRRVGELISYAGTNAPELADRHRLQRYYIGAVERNGRTLLAAHIIGRVARTGALIDALVMPREISEGLPMLLAGTSTPPAPHQWEAAAVAASTFIPKSSVMQRAIENARADIQRVHATEHHVRATLAAHGMPVEETMREYQEQVDHMLRGAKRRRDQKMQPPKK